MDQIDESLSSLIQYGVSDELINTIQAIEESTNEHSQLLYLQQSIRELRCSVFCQNYARSIWECSHYLAFINHHHSLKAIDFFWYENILHNDSFKHWLNKIDDLQYDENKQPLISLGDRKFTLHPSRINLVATWTTFLIFIDPTFIERLNKLGDDLTSQSIDMFSKETSQKLSNYLSLHLDGVQQKRQGKALLEWLKKDAKSEDRHFVNDDSILQFWKDMSSHDDADFKRFNTVAEVAYRLYDAITIGQAQRQINKPQHYQQLQDSDSNPWMLDHLSKDKDQENFMLFEAILNSTNPELSVTNLATDPFDKIKFLTKKDFDFYIAFEEAGESATALPLTFLRQHVFGFQQGRISEAIRSARTESVLSLIQCSDFQGYEIWLVDFYNRQTKLQTTHEAILYVLLHLLPNDSLSAISLKELSEHTTANKEQLQKSFSKINRTGFKELPKSDHIDKYGEGERIISYIKARISSYERSLSLALEKTGGSLHAELKDRLVFASVFSDLYADRVSTE